VLPRKRVALVLLVVLVNLGVVTVLRGWAIRHARGSTFHHGMSPDGRPGGFFEERGLVPPWEWTTVFPWK
jgi:hypothetical protein